MDVPSRTLEDLSGRAVFHSRLREELLSIPGVESASFSSHRPLGGGRQSQSIQIPGVLEPDPGQQPAVFRERVGADYFSVLQVPILHGREFRTTDREGRRVMVINEVAWAQYWKRDEAVGSTVLLGNDPSPWQVVGIVGNQRNPDADQPPLPIAYLPFAEDVPANFSIFIRSPLEAGSLLPAVRRELARLSPDTPIYNAQTLQEMVYNDHASDYAIIGLMNFFSFIALGLAVAGIYSVTAFSVNRRLHEFGVRTAMGALRGDLIRLAVKQSLTPLLIGLGLGLLAAFFASQLISGALYGVAPGDPLTFGAVVVGLLGLGLLASLLPTLGAVRKDLVNRLRA